MDIDFVFRVAFYVMIILYSIKEKKYNKLNNEYISLQIKYDNLANKTKFNSENTDTI
ncbi:MAG: hypothetical protein K2N73_15720 [Lachnospiraceae bacterium]|nr:hypothetical protein [Lachnospiraceae bacterium]